MTHFDTYSIIIYDTVVYIASGRINIMKKLSVTKLAEVMKTKRKELNLTQAQLSKMTNINRAIISRMEMNNFIPSIIQLENLAKVLNFDINTLFYDENANNVFVALRSKNLTEEEKEGVENLYTLMITLQQQIVLSESLKK